MSDIEFTDKINVELIRADASDLQVARAAWVSTKGVDAREADGERVSGLINYLMKGRHGTPFEHNSFTFLIECPIFVVREFHRHRTGWSYNEMSGRYTEMKPKFYVPNEHRNLRQVGRPGAYTFEPGSEAQVWHTQRALQNAAEYSWDQYEHLLNMGIAKEVARMCLPLNIFTAFYATCNARSLMHFLGLRTEDETATFKSHPQHEIQLVADRMEDDFMNYMPETWAAWQRNGRVAP